MPSPDSRRATRLLTVETGTPRSRAAAEKALRLHDTHEQCDVVEVQVDSCGHSKNRFPWCILVRIRAGRYLSSVVVDATRREGGLEHVSRDRHYGQRWRRGRTPIDEERPRRPRAGARPKEGRGLVGAGYRRTPRDFTDIAALTEALQGVDGAYLMLPPLPLALSGLPGSQSDDRRVP